MLILAEGTIRRPIPDAERTAVQAWFGPMIDGGFMQSGYVDAAGGRCWMLLSSPTLADAQQRLGDLPVVRDRSVTFTTTKVHALRFE
ncbi:MAG: hypothetical protein M3O32_05560 [Actinomycetota bacterium]|nr:hypothetical protein [Actinomycetota bacterium]